MKYTTSIEMLFSLLLFTSYFELVITSNNHMRGKCLMRE